MSDQEVKNQIRNDNSNSSPPEPEDDYVTDEPLPSMAMDQSHRHDSNDGENGETNGTDDVFNGPPSKQPKIEDNYSADRYVPYYVM